MGRQKSKGIEIDLLGDVRIRHGDQVVDAFPYDKVRALLALLATERGAPPRREWLASLLWPQLAAPDGRRNLRIALAHLNKALGGHATSAVLAADRVSIAFAPDAPVQTDVGLLEQAPTACTNPLEAAAMAEALRRYRGPFLGNLTLPDNPEFDDWVAARREACLRRAMLMAEGLAVFHHRQGALERALDYAERAVALDRHNTGSQRRLIELLAESGRHAAALSQYQSYERLVAEHPGGKGAPRAPLGGTPPTATPMPAVQGPRERRHVTILHVDLHDAVGGQDDDAALRLDTAHRQAAELASREGGHCLPQAGGLLAYFGYPSAREHGARDALRAAGALIAAAAAAGVVARGGLHSGSMLSGGSPQRPDATGTLTRIAGELARHAGDGEVVVSDSTLPLLGASLSGMPLTVALGAGASVAAVRLRQGRDDDVIGGPSQSAPPRSPFVGRENELAELESHWAAARTQGLRVVLVRGEPGVGKSRLARAFVGGLRARGALVHEAGCDPRHDASPYYPVIRLVIQALGLSESGGEAGGEILRREQIRAYLTREAPLRAHPWDEDAEALLAHLLGLATPDDDDVVLRRPAQQLRDALDTLLAELLTHGASRQPVALLVEDMHWADPSTLALLARVLESSTHPPALLLLTARPGFVPPHHGIPLLELGPLAPTDAETLVAASLGDARVSPDLIARIARASDGVPLYAEEMARMVAAGQSSDNIPPTLQDVLAARLEAVGEARAIASMAATIGREFSLALLAATLPRHLDDLPATLERLCAAGLIERLGPGRYRFRHALVQEAAYRRLGEHARVQAHEAVARALSGRFAAQVTQAPEILAHHLTGAQHPREAIECWLRAARAALAGAANAEAIAHAEAGLRLVGELPPASRPALELALRIEQGTALLATAGYGAREGAEVFARAHALLSDDTGPAERFRVLWGVWMGSSSLHGYRVALELAQQLHQLARGMERPALLAASHYALGNNLFWLARFEEARQHFQAAADLAEMFPHREAILLLGEDPVVTSQAFLGWTHWFLGAPATGVAACEESLRLGRQLGHPHSLGYALTFAAVLHRLEGDPERVATLSDELLALAEARRLPLWFAAGSVLRGWALAHRGQPEGLALGQAALEGMRNTMVAVRVPFLVIMAESCIALGLHAQALPALDLAEQAVQELADLHFCAELARLRAHCLAHAGATGAEVEAHLRRATDLARQQAVPLLEIRALDDLVAQATAPDPAWRARLADLRTAIGTTP